MHRLRTWDSRTANGVDYFISISDYISRRIKKIYGKDSTVIYPPVDISNFDSQEEKEDFYLTVSRFVPYKKINLIVDAFNRMPDKKLVVIGDGPDFKKIKKSGSSNVQFLGHQSFSQLKSYLKKAKAFIYAAEEDFGIVMVEAQACGTPVIAFRKGGAVEILRGLEQEDPTGIFFPEQSEESLMNAVGEFESFIGKIIPENCKKNAIRFNVERFRKEFKEFVKIRYSEFLASINHSFQKNNMDSLQLINKK